MVFRSLALTVIISVELATYSKSPSKIIPWIIQVGYQCYLENGPNEKQRTHVFHTPHIEYLQVVGDIYQIPTHLRMKLEILSNQLLRR